MVRGVISRLALKRELQCPALQVAHKNTCKATKTKTKMEYKYFCMTLSYAS
jgi:hypothetical protein